MAPTPHAVLTRDDVASYAARLAPMGLEVVAMPVTHTAPPADPDALAHALAEPYAAIVVASARAAAEIAHAGTPHGELWAVGPATLRALVDAGLRAEYPSGVRDGADLARALIAARELAGRRVLVPHAEDGRPDVAELLRAAGADVVEVIAYRTVPTPAGDPALAAGLERLATAAICVVFAPSQVSALAALAGPLDRLAARFCAIGETTAAALHAAGVAEVAVAPTPTPEGIARAVSSVYPPRQ